LSIYPKKPHVIAQQNGILVSHRRQDKVVDVKPKMPCSVIVVHGVNDVGTSYAAVEEGVCAGLQKRLSAHFVPAKYSNPTAADANKVVDDPDDIYFKRQADVKTFSPIIPFYWGYAESPRMKTTREGQIVDRYGNRLDKDFTKGGGPFANATSTLPDMWNRGASWSRNISSDPLRPLFNAPPRRYMVLAAKRLAALIAMIRDYDPDETVNVVAHSQGCLITLLAQAFLKDQGCRPADAVILMHPPYAISEKASSLVQFSEFFRNGEEKAMRGAYFALNGWQNLNARLQTLVNIVHTIGQQTVKPLDMGDFLKPGSPYYGTVGATWKPTNDRDNRRKVFLYFCPEDMTVALDNIQGIGWQGVPDFIEGTALPEAGTTDSSEGLPQEKKIKREALKELGDRFYQRVFTDKKRIDPKTGRNADVLVGMPPHGFALRIKGEDDLARFSITERMARDRPPEVEWPVRKKDFWGRARSDEEISEGIRRITGEALSVPVKADMRGSQQIDTREGPAEVVDPIDAATAVASGKGIRQIWELIDNLAASDSQIDDRAAMGSPDPATYAGPVQDMKRYIPFVQKALNDNKPVEQRCQVLDVYQCLLAKNKAQPRQLLILRTETPNEARLRWQHAVSLKSFHGAIIGSSKNHEGVTAYDLAIGQGKAVADPDFCAYLCAVADWRLKTSENSRVRPSILQWKIFLTQFHDYWEVEPEWRKKLIAGNCNYYSTGELPTDLPILPDDMPSDLISETIAGWRMTSPRPVQPKKHTS
jgi:pimeloyl-ACP methyl ester carboxylesterase